MQPLKTNLFLALILLFSIQSFSQTEGDSPTGIAFGLSGGYASNSNVVGEFSLGYQFEETHHLSTNLIVFSQNSVKVPVIGELRYGYKCGIFEPFVGVGYHYASYDDVYARKYVNGVKPAYGIILHYPTKPWILTAAMSGNIFSVKLGILGVR